jgi:precorrin-2/cobalt-factor-2 C20-methyltransferase
MDQKRQGTFFAVSTGPGDAAMMTVQAVKILEQCNTIFYPCTAGERVRQIAGDTLAGSVNLDNKKLIPVVFEMTRQTDVLSQTYGGAASLCIEHLSAGEDIAFLSIGDVSLYSTAGHLASIVRAQGFPVVYIPGVSSVSAAACACALDLAGRDSPVSILPGDAFYTAGTLQASLAAPGTKVIMKTTRHLEHIIALLIDMKLSDRTWVVQNCSMENEHRYTGAQLLSLPSSFFSNSYLTVIIVTAQESE